MPITLLKYIAFGTMTGSAFFGGFVPSPTSLSGTSYGDVALSVHQSHDTLDAWIEKLIWLESEGNERATVLDVNGRHSFGCLQFQTRTFLEFGEKFGVLSEQDKANADRLIYNCKLQKQIARRILEDDPNGWEHWYTSVMKRGLGLPPIEKNSENRETIAPLIARLGK